VKALSVAAAQSVSAIRLRMQALQESSMRAIDGMNRICGEVGEIAPICGTIAQAVAEQRETIVDLAERMNKAQTAVASMSSAVRSISSMTDSAHAISVSAGTQNDAAAGEAQQLGRRVVTILRSMEAADRRQHERFPIDLAIRIRVGAGTMACRSFDVSEGGLLIKAQADLALAVGTTYEADISQIGQMRLRVRRDIVPRCALRIR